MQLSGAQIVWRELEQLGVEVVFGYPGGAVLPIYDALSGSRIRHVLVRHEQGATHMADGYARASGRVGVALATSGPGATNMVTGLATAMMDSSPLICITGQVASPLLGSDAFQETDITGITLPVTKFNCLVTRTEDIAPQLRRAFALATSARPGPVLVDITKDAQVGRCEWAPSPCAPRPGAGAESDLEPELAAAQTLLQQARRPLILAGHGVTLAGAERDLLAFVESTGVPVALTLLGIGCFPSSHPMCLGMMGMHGAAWVNRAIQSADLLLAFGMRFDDRVTGDLARYAPRARKIHIEIDPAEIGKNVRADVALCADLRAVLRRWLPRARGGSFARAGWLEAIARDRMAAAEEFRHEPHGPLHPAWVMQELSRATRGEAIVVTDVGQHQMWEAQHYRHEGPRTLITSGGLGTMGFALPAAIGAQMAQPHSEVWVVAGDGGFQMTLAELATVAQESLPLKIALINNGALGMVRQWQDFFYQRRFTATPISGPDWPQLAAAYGVSAVRAVSPVEARAAIAEARLRPGPALIEFQVEAEAAVLPMVPAAAALDEMIEAKMVAHG